MGDDALFGRRKTKPLTHVRTGIAPHDCHLVAFYDQVFYREAGIECRAHHADGLFQAFDALALLRERVVLDVVRPGHLVEDLEPAVVYDLLVETQDRLLVLTLVFRHLDLLHLSAEAEQSGRGQRP